MTYNCWTLATNPERGVFCNDTFHHAELGVGIGEKEYWGKGYGRDAVNLLLEYGFRYRNLHRVYLSTQGNNERALRCYRACGFVEEGRLREHVWSSGQYHDLVYMGVLRAEWQRDGSSDLAEQE